MNARHFVDSLCCLILVLFLAVSASAAPEAPVSASSALPGQPVTIPDEEFHSSPVMFIENVGQFADGARFQVWGGPAGTMWLAEDAIWLTVVEPSSDDVAGPPVERSARFAPEYANREGDPAPRRGANIKLSFVGANSHPRIEPFDRLDTVVSYFIGNEPGKWRPNVPIWGGVRYVDLYPGVDLELTSEAGQWVQRLAARPGTDLAAAQLRVEGASDVTAEGDVLRLGTVAGEFALPLLRASGLPVAGVQVSPRSAQMFEVAAPFTASNANAQMASVNPLSTPQGVADLRYGTFLGGGGWEMGYGIAVDGAGSAYVTGYTGSDNFPTTPGAFDTSHKGGNEDAFVVKLNPAGSGLAYATFLGGSGHLGEGL